MKPFAFLNARSVRNALKILLVVLLAGIVFYRLRLAAVPVEIVPVVQGEIVAEVLAVTHDQRALDVFDRILKMEDGVFL